MPTNLLKFPKVSILRGLISLATFLGLFMAPALPEIAFTFRIREVTAALVISVFLMGYALGQLLYGPLASFMGRKKALYTGLLVALIGTFLGYYSESFSSLVFARFIQALGASSGLKIAFTIIGDLHAKDGARASTGISVSFGLMSAITLLLGGLATEYVGWQSSFLFQALYIVLIGIACFLLPETGRAVKIDAFSIRSIRADYLRYFKDPFIVLHAFLMGLATFVIYTFATFAPFISADYLGLTPFSYGLWAFIAPLGIVFGALISRKSNIQHNSRANFLSGIIVTLFTIVVIALFFARQEINVWILFFSGFFLYLGCSQIWPNAILTALEDAKNKGNAMAVMQFINVGVPALGVTLALMIPVPINVLYPALLGFVVVLMLGAWFKLKPHY